MNASFQGSINAQEIILSQDSQKRKKVVSFLHTPSNVNEIELNIEQTEPDLIHLEDGTQKAVKIIQQSDQQQIQLDGINLQDLRFLTGYSMKSLRIINLSKNLISSIDILSQFQQLKEIDASYNYIEDVNLNLPRLMILNLQNNYLKKFPIIEYSMSLKIINLNSNHLEDLNDMMPHFTPNIQELDIGYNSIALDFNRLQDFDNFHDKIMEMKQLRSLYIRGNDFLQKEYLDQYEGFNIQDQIFKHNKQLEFINDEDRDILKKKIQEAKSEKDNQQILKIKTKMKDQENENQNNQITEKQENSQKKKEKKQKEYLKKNVHSLQDLLNELESANAYSSQALKHLKNLAEKVDENLVQKDKIQEFLAPNKNENEIEELIDTFIMNAQMLIINSSELQGIMLSILAKLSIIEYMDFGVECFNLLKDVMKSGKELQNQVAKVIETEVIYRLKEPDPTKISKALLKGLIDLIQDDEENSQMLAPMFEMQFPVWLRNYCELLDVKKAKNQTMEDNENYDAVIQLFSVSVFDQKNTERSKEQEIVPKITKIFRQTRQENKRYIPCLNSIQRLSNNSSTAADDFIISFVHIDLIDEINKSIQIYKRSNSLFDKNSKESVLEQMHKYQVLAAEIVALGSLMNSQHRQHILDSPAIQDIIQIMSHNRTDPILLTAICKFALNLFKCEELKSDPDYMAPILDKISNMSYLIPYLGGSMYNELLQMTNRYHYSKQKNFKISSNNKNQKDQKKNSDQSQLNISKISNYTKKNKDGKKQDDAKMISEEEKINISLKNLDDWIVNDLFVAIINLIQFFQEEAQINEVNPLFRDIQESLNQQNREDALFNALQVQNNEVQVAVVNCLFAVPVSGFDDNEVSKLSQIVCTCKNLSSGQTELIMSTVFWILIKFIYFTNDEEVSEICINFQRKYGEFIVIEALSILQRNLERQIYDEDEDREKYTLSLSVINFLKISSTQFSPIMHNYLRNQKNHKIFKQILLNEDLNSTQNVQKMPIDIENTLIGKDIQSLIQMIQGEFSQSLQPYSDVSLRMIMGMANILMNVNNQNYKYLKETEHAVKDLFGFSEFTYKKNKQYEMNFWIDQYNFVESLSDLENYDIIQQHIIFTKQEQVINILIDFLVTKLPLNEQLLNSMSDPLFSYEYQQLQNKNKVSLLHQVKEKTKHLQNKFKKRYFNRQDPFSIRKYRYLKENKTQYDNIHECDSINHNVDILDEEQRKLHYLKDTDENKSNYNMNLEELGKDYYMNQANNQDDEQQDQDGENEKVGNDKLNLGKQINTQLNELKNFKSSRGDGFENLKLRSLSTAAYLRCIYASIEYAPSMDLRMQAIKNLNNPQLLCQLTQLCDSVEWDENSNIGSKYLRVMRHIILMPFDKSKEESHKIMYYNLISIVIQKLLNKIVNKLKSEIQLTDGDKITNYEVSYIFFLIMQQTNYFVFSNLDIVEVYRQKELQISNIKKELAVKMKQDPQNLSLDDQLQSGGAFKDTFDPKTNQYIKKCLYQDLQSDNFDQIFTKNEFSQLENHKIFLPDIRKKRTVQTKVVEFLVLKLFSKESIFSLLEILFKDMTSDHRIFDKALKLCKKDEENDEAQEYYNNQKISKQLQDYDYNEDKQLDDDEIEELIVAQKLQMKQEEYISVKSVITIERIKDIVGEIMNTCQKKMKYDILEYIMKGVIFSQKILRESFMQEILLSADRSTYRTSLQNYINQNELTILNLSQQAALERDDAVSYLGSIDSRKYIERILICDLVDINTVIRIMNHSTSTPDQSQQPDNLFTKRLFVVSNKGIQIMRDVDQSISCQNCPPYEFCPRGPQQDFFINYEDIQTIITVPQMPQKLIIYYQASNEQQNWSSSFSQLSYKSQLKNTNLKHIHYQVQLTLNLQTFTIASQIFFCIKQIMMEIESQKQYSKKQIIQEGINFGNQKQNCQEEQKNDKFSNKFTTLQEKQIYYDLKYLISQISKKEDKQNIKNMQLIYGSLKQTKQDPVSDQYFKENIETKSFKPNIINQTALIRFITEKWMKKSIPSDVESTLLQNPVIVCVTDNYLLLMKEKWAGWKFQSDKQMVNKYSKDMNNMLSTEEQPNENSKDLMKDMEEYCKKRKTEIFQLLICVKLMDIKSLIVHKNKEPSVEINWIKDKKIKIQFNSDMERQMFVDMLWEWKQENVANKQEDEDQKGNEQNTPFEEDEAQRFQQDESDSDDNPPDLVVYY